MATKARGRPKRGLDSANPKDRKRYREDLEITRVVFEAVLNGKPYRDGIDIHGALSEGVKRAQYLGIKITQDGVEAIVERVIQDPEALYRSRPTLLRDNLAKLAAGFMEGKTVPVTSGSRTRFISPKPFIPESDGDRPRPLGPTLKIQKKNPPGN
jgi:hypothetical protein